MNRRVCVCVGSMVWFGLLAGAASGQSSIATPGNRAGRIDVAVKIAPDATPYTSTIQQFIQDQVKQIVQDDPVTQKAAREKLITECTSDSMPSFLGIYTAKLNDAVQAELVSSAAHPLPSLPVRLNLAVLVEAVAHAAKNANLKGAVLKLIDDPSDPIAMWGMKAAKPVIASIVANPPPAPDPLIAAILPAVKKHVKSGYVAEEAYHALTPDVNGLNGAGSAVMHEVMDPILDVLQFRVTQYQTTIPDNPEAENAIANLLWKNYDSVTPAEQQRIIQLLVNLITCAGQQSPNATKIQSEQISNSLKIAAQALQIIIESKLNQHTQSLAPLVLNPGQGKAILEKTAPVYGELKQLTPLAFLQAPPTVTPATMPATTPSDDVAAGH